eukprot:1566230-Amphidinium_carterae.1
MEHIWWHLLSQWRPLGANIEHVANILIIVTKQTTGCVGKLSLTSALLSPDSIGQQADMGTTIRNLLTPKTAN